MTKQKNIHSKSIKSILLIIGLGSGLYFSFVLGLYRLEKKESNEVIYQSTTPSNSSIQKSIDMNLLLYYYFRSVK